MNEADFKEVLNRIICVLDSKQNKIVDSPLPSIEKCKLGTIYNSGVVASPFREGAAVVIK